MLAPGSPVEPGGARWSQGSRRSHRQLGCKALPREASTPPLHRHNTRPQNDTWDHQQSLPDNPQLQPYPRPRHRPRCPLWPAQISAVGPGPSLLPGYQPRLSPLRGRQLALRLCHPRGSNSEKRSGPLRGPPCSVAHTCACTHRRCRPGSHSSPASLSPSLHLPHSINHGLFTRLPFLP